MDYKKKQPTADCIVARLTPYWGSRVSLLFKVVDPYEHYCDENGDEVPYGAIVSWNDVELPPEGEDEKIKKTAIKILRGVAPRVFEYEGVRKESVLAYLEKQEEVNMPDPTQLIELWHEDKEMLKEKDFRGDAWRLAYNAFLCGFGRGIVVKRLGPVDKQD